MPAHDASAAHRSARLRRALLRGLSVPLLVTAAAGPAAAATTTYRCPPSPTGPGACTVALAHPVASEVRVTVDKSGRTSTVFPWSLRAQEQVVCSGTYRPVDPPVVAVCRAPAGRLLFTTLGGTPADGTTTVTISS